MSAQADECARMILEVIPTIMRVMRAEFRHHRGAELSVPQFRALTFIRNNPGTSLSDLAEHLGLTAPSTSKMVDGLVASQFILRDPSQEDRRRVTMQLTPAGQEILASAMQATEKVFAGLLSNLDAAERETVMQAMVILRPLFDQ